MYFKLTKQFEFATTESVVFGKSLGLAALYSQFKAIPYGPREKRIKTSIGTWHHVWLNISYLNNKVQ